MNNIGKVGDIMTRQVISVREDDSLEHVSQLFEQYDFDGLPVVDATNKLTGIITAYDMIVQSSGMHLPTVLNIMQQISVNQADKKDLDEHFQKLKEIKISQVMNRDPLTVKEDLALETAAKLFAEHHRVNPLVVTDENGILTGVLSRYDVIKFFNEQYFNQVVQNVTTYRSTDQGQSKSVEDIRTQVGDISKEFLLVTKRRPKIWKFIAVGAFIAGLIAATALIIRIVKKEDQYGSKSKPQFVIHIDSNRVI